MRDLPERHAATATLPGIMLEQSLLRVMLPDQREHPLGRLSLRQHAILGAARAWSAGPRSHQARRAGISVAVGQSSDRSDGASATLVRVATFPFYRRVPRGRAATRTRPRSDQQRTLTPR